MVFCYDTAQEDAEKVSVALTRRFVEKVSAAVIQVSGRLTW
jgi:hypothetical protein